MASKKKHVRDARFRDRAPSTPATPTPDPPRAADAYRAKQAAPAAKAPPRRTAVEPIAPPEPPPPWWRTSNFIVPVVLAVGVGVAMYTLMRGGETASTHDAGVYAPEPRPLDAAVDAGAAPAAPTPAVAVPAPAVDAAAGPADGAAADAGAQPVLNGNPVQAVTAEPTSPDPRGGRFTIAQATEGLAGRGDLVAEIDTSMGVFTCTLLAGEAPLAVANFVGLARGRREFWDPVAGAWTRRPFYDGSIFHRVIPEFMIQGGDQLRSGMGGTGYTFADENVRGHNAAGQLCMANRGPNTNGAQFFITEGPTAQLDGSYTIFGRCTPAELVGRIARVPHNSTRPVDPVFIRQVRVRRG